MTPIAIFVINLLLILVQGLNYLICIRIRELFVQKSGYRLRLKHLTINFVWLFLIVWINQILSVLILLLVRYRSQILSCIFRLWLISLSFWTSHSILIELDWLLNTVLFKIAGQLSTFILISISHQEMISAFQLILRYYLLKWIARWSENGFVVYRQLFFKHHICHKLWNLWLMRLIELEIQSIRFLKGKLRRHLLELLIWIRYNRGLKSFLLRTIWFCHKASISNCLNWLSVTEKILMLYFTKVKWFDILFVIDFCNLLTVYRASWIFPCT